MSGGSSTTEELKKTNLTLKYYTCESDEPKHNAFNEQHVPKKVHQFYFVKFLPYEDPKLKARIQEAEKQINRLGQEKNQISQKITDKMFDKGRIISKLDWIDYFRDGARREKMNDLQLALDKLCFANSAYQGRPVHLCFSDGEVDKHKLQFWMLHRTKNLAAERRLLKQEKMANRRGAVDAGGSSLKELEDELSRLKWRFNYNKAANKHLLGEMKQLKLAWEKKIAEAAVKGKTWYSLGSKEDLISQSKILSSELDGSMEKQQKIRAEIKGANSIEKDISFLKQKLSAVDRRKDYLHQTILKLRKMSSEENACYDRYLSLLNTAEKLAEMKDVAALEELSHIEVERFMSEWNASKAFRDDHFEKRVLPSLEDGWVRDTFDGRFTTRLKLQPRGHF